MLGPGLGTDPALYRTCRCVLMIHADASFHPQTERGEHLYLMVMLRPRDALERRLVLGPDLVLVPLHEHQQGLVPHRRQLPLIRREPREVVHQGVHLCSSNFDDHQVPENLARDAG